MPLLPSLLFCLQLLHALTSANDTNDVNIDISRPTADPEVAKLQAEVKRLRINFKRFKTGGLRGQTGLCQAASDQLSDRISLELSGLRGQLHTSDSVTSLRAELQHALAALRAEVAVKVKAMQGDLDAGRTTSRAELQDALRAMETETERKQQAACSQRGELTADIAAMDTALNSARSDLQGRLEELGRRVGDVRADMESGLVGVKADIARVTSDLHDLLAKASGGAEDGVAVTRAELQTGLAAAQSALMTSLQALQSDVTSLSAKVDVAVTSVKAEVSEAQADLETAMTSQREARTRMEQGLAGRMAGMARRSQTVSAQIAYLFRNASSLTHDLHLLKTQSESNATVLKSDLAKDLAALTTRLEASMAKTKAEMAREAQETFSGVAEAFYVVNDNVTSLKERVTFIRDDLQGQIEDLRHDLQGKVSDLQTSVKDTQAHAVAKDQQLVTMATNVSSWQRRLKKAESLGSTFVRWGRTACTPNSTLVYSGVVGGSSYDVDGGAANRLCMTLTPEAGSASGARTYLYGAEYKFSEHHDLDVVCAVCLAPLPATLMIPGTRTCPSGWTPQYAGHLTAGMAGHRAPSEFLCLDSAPEHRAGSQGVRNGALFYFVFAQCGSLPCPPYRQMYVSCVVCSK